MKKLLKLGLVFLLIIIVFFLIFFCRNKNTDIMNYSSVNVNDVWMYWYIEDTTIHFSSTAPAGLYEDGNTGTYYITKYSTKSNGECYDNDGNMIGPSAEQRKMITKAVFDNYINAEWLTGLFNYYENLIEIKNLNYLNTSKVKSMGVMFQHCDSLKSIDLSNFDTGNATSMSAMFSYCQSLTELDVSKFDTSKVKDMGALFNNCSSLTSIDVSKFDTSKVTSMLQMFANCNELTSLDLSSFDTKNVETMTFMFLNDTNLETIFVSDKFVTNKVVGKDKDGFEAGHNMFENCVSLVGGNGTEFKAGMLDKRFACIDTFYRPGFFTKK